MQSTFDSSIPTIKLLDGNHIPWLGWGNGTGNSRSSAVEAGVAAVKAGIVHIDTAQGYSNEGGNGENERAVKPAIEGAGKQKSTIWVTTKLSQEGGAADKEPIPTSKVKDMVRESIKNLGFQPNLILVHNPFVPERGQLVAFWKELEDMVDSGELKASLGVSNFRPCDFEELLPHCKHIPVTNQIEAHPFVWSHIKPLLDLQEKHGIVTSSYGGLSPVLRTKSKGGPLKPVLERIASRLQEHGEADETTVLLLWSRAKNIVTVTASANPSNIAKMAKAQQLPNLTQKEVDEIDSIGSEYHFRAYDEHMEGGPYEHKFPVPKGLKKVD